MKETVYYFRTVSGKTVFSTGAVKPAEKVGEYIRMLRYAKYPLEQLHLDNIADYKTICDIFNIQNKSWQDIYNEL